MEHFWEPREPDSYSNNGHPLVILDNGAHSNISGDFQMFSGFYQAPELVLIRGFNGSTSGSVMSGFVRNERFELHKVFYNFDVGRRLIVSGPELDDLGYEFRFVGGGRIVTDGRTGVVVGEGRKVATITPWTS